MKKILRISLIFLLIPLLYVGGMIGYAMLTDYDPQGDQILQTSSNPPLPLQQDTLSLLIWNLGFGGLGAGSDFFYDGGKMVHSPEASVRENVAQQQAFLRTEAANTDLILLQEVDVNSSRSYEIDQAAGIQAALPNFGATFAPNYDVSFIPIPFTEPMGAVYGGLLSLSRFQVQATNQHPFVGNYDWPTYLFFLDRCFLSQRFALPGGKELVVVNTHNSAYDDGSLKQQQMEQLQTWLLAETQTGNQVIVGGDWNQFPPDFTGIAAQPLDSALLDPSLYVKQGYPAPGWTWAFDPTVPTNRSLEAPFAPQTSRQVVIDYFLLSPGIELLQVEGVPLGFVHSDHNPVRLQVRLGEN
jgi:endonuclease/exonuclease/phosphatase family metal-dependent hydrolase